MHSLTPLPRRILGLLLFSAGALHAQATLGTWQGTLASGPFSRIVIRVTKASDGSIRARAVPVDGPGNEMPLMDVKATDTEFSFGVGNVTYTGKLSADGKAIVGTWAMTGATQTLKLDRTTPETVWTAGAAPKKKMAADADPSFEVATIKPSDPESKAGIQYILGRRQFKAVNCTAGELIKMAYTVRGKQVDGGPKFLREQKYDVVAETDVDIPGEPSEEQTRTMVRKLLVERFGMKVHMGEKEFTVYSMTVDKPSERLMKSEGDPTASMMLVGKPADDSHMAMQFENASMKEFAALMMNFVQTHLIVDDTGLKGKYDFKLVMQRSAFAPPASPDELPDAAFIEGIQQLGLKWTLKKEMIPMVIVDEIHEPTAN